MATLLMVACAAAMVPRALRALAEFLHARSIAKNGGVSGKSR